MAGIVRNCRDRRRFTDPLIVCLRITVAPDIRNGAHVTHAIEEAVYLANRSVIPKPSPGRLATEFRNQLPRPRDRSSTSFLAVKSRIMQEMQRHGVPRE